LSLIGDLAATTLTRAQLYDRQRRQIEELQTLAQVSETVTSPLYLDEMLGIVTEMAAQIMDASVCHVYLLDDTHATLQRHTGNSDQLSDHPRFQTDQGIIGRVVTTSLSAYVPYLANEADYEESVWAQGAGLVSLLSVPLSVRDRVIGVLNCYTNQYRKFSGKERTLLATLANQMALAIENAQLITNTAVVREMHHRIKNNLQTIAMLMQLQIYETDLPATRHALETNIHRIRSIASVHEILSEKGFRLVNVKDVLNRITQTTVETMLTPDQNINIHVHGETLQLPSRPATALTLVVNELVQNALEHALSDQPQGQIDISLGHSPEEFIILVRDNGRGLPADFTPNLGLEITETLVRDDLHGRIKFNNIQSGTEVSIRFPRRIQHDH
jgi:two-component sensor histidine kinase